MSTRTLLSPSSTATLTFIGIVQARAWIYHTLPPFSAAPIRPCLVCQTGRSIVVCQDRLDLEVRICPARLAAPPFVAVGPELELQRAPGCRDIVVFCVNDRVV